MASLAARKLPADLLVSLFIIGILYMIIYSASDFVRNIVTENCYSQSER